jgi:hypothetical protein
MGSDQEIRQRSVAVTASLPVFAMRSTSQVGGFPWETLSRRSDKRRHVLNGPGVLEVHRSICEYDLVDNYVPGVHRLS